MLTETQVRNAKPTDRPRKLYDARGLFLQVMPHGGRWWRFSYRFHDKNKTLSLGIYPDVSLAKARARHQEAREQLAEGIDPSSARCASGRDFEAVAREWFAHWSLGRNQRYAQYVLARLEADVFPDIGSRPLCELSNREITVPAERSRQVLRGRVVTHRTHASVSVSRRAWRESGTAAARRNANTDELGGTH